MNNKGKVALVGAGPGDAGLLTVRGAQLLKNADCVVYDRLLNKEFLELPGDDCEKIYVGKENHHHTLDQDSINKLLYEKAKEYELVVRLKGGDPYVFGRGGEEALFLIGKGVEVEVVPGISSSVAAAALSGIPVTHRGLSKGFEVITAHSRNDSISDLDFTKLTDEDMTLVFLMGLSHVAEIAESLIKAGRSANTEIAVVSNGTMPHQKKCVGNLGNIAELVANAKLQSPAVIIVGKVVSLSDTLSFFEKRPLFGKKFFLPEIEKYEYSFDKEARRIPNELRKMLVDEGAEVVTITAGRITPVRIAPDILDEIKPEDCIAFTSVSGVNAFIYNLAVSQGRDIRNLPNCRYAVVGEKTAMTLLKYGIRADEVSDKSNSSDLADKLRQKIDGSASIYWFCGKKHTEDFEEKVGSKFRLVRIICYENEPNEEEISADQKQTISDCDGTILTCGSNARFAVSQMKTLPGKVYSIGPACTKVLRSLGVDDISQAYKSSYEGIVSMLKQY